MKKMILDGNTATARVSYALSSLAIIYPITPSSPIAEQVDEWANANVYNLFNETPKVVQMQSESGVAGALHGALTCGALATTYTCSQGLLLMLPNLYKIAGELLPTVIHVSARALATHALSIFGDHQDVMACRQTGFALLASSSVQETSDLALVAHLATLKSSIPFIHFFDGFRTSHEICDVETLEYDEMRSLLDERDIERFKARALTPDAPKQRGTAQNPDIYFQNRERANVYYQAVPNIVQATMDKVAQITGRRYRIFDYVGAPDATDVVVAMGSATSTLEETVEKLRVEGRKVGLIKVRLYRPFDSKAFCQALPKTCRRIAVLDRTKESGSAGEPLYLDVVCALSENGMQMQTVVGGRYGLGSKDFTPSDAYAVLENLSSETPKNHFTVGICDDLTHTSLPKTTPFFLENKDCVACKFYGLGSDGTVGANKNSIKIIGEHTQLHVQAYFEYDSRKSGGFTISHLRFGTQPIHAPYLIDRADFVACHTPSYLQRYDVLENIRNEGIFLLNCPYADENALNEYLPPAYKRQIAEKRLRFYVIDATKIANEVGLSERTSTVMQTAFFLLQPNLLPYEKAVGYLKAELEKKFIKKGKDVVEKNFSAIDRVRSEVKQIAYPNAWSNSTDEQPCNDQGNAYYRQMMRPILTLHGDELPTSAFQADGTAPTGTTKYERHGVAQLLPEWIEENCIQCNQCSFVCPHACIRPFLLEENATAPENFITKPAVGLPNTRFRVQVDPFDCMGCGVCANICPAKEKALIMRPSAEGFATESERWNFAVTVRYPAPEKFPRHTVKGSQFRQPLFEFSYACSGCGETPYIKVLTQLFGERMLIANATGCSSIYGGSAPSCPYTVNHDGKGPAWANSLFEDNAEFGFGMRLAYDTKNDRQKSVWIIGGDGWAYDIGFGGLDHVLASGANVNILVLDSEVYSNTGGQLSKATPLGAIARFATAGKRTRKKNLGLMAMSYGDVYVAQVSMGANKQHLLNTFIEAESYDGPSLIIAYSPCIAHGAHMSRSMDEEKRAVDCGYWHLYRYNPTLRTNGKNPFTLDSKAPTADFQEFLNGENRFASLKRSAPDVAERLFEQAESESRELYTFYQRLASFHQG